MDNPKKEHIKAVEKLAEDLNEKQMNADGNCMVRVLHCKQNEGASFAQNFCHNASSADWVLFLDDDVVPDENIPDGCIGSLKDCPDAKVFAGPTELPMKCNF